MNAEPPNHDDSILDLLRKSPAEQAPSDESTPEQIWDGKYRLKECLGGQMNNVFRAERIDMSDMPVVVKILATASARHRMIEQEKEVLGKLSTLGNPHIVAPIDAGEYQGARYIVTSFVDGVHLGEYVADKKRPLSVSEICAIGRQAAEGLAAAHEMAIVHGDIKPNNLVIKDRQVKIIDWGVSLDLNSMGEEEGILGGTVDFMPPEQLNGDSIDGRTDVYSLGVTLVTLLLGGKLPDPASWWLNCKQELPDGLRELLSRMMSANPSSRPTMAEVETSLATFTSNGDIERPSVVSAPRSTYRSLLVVAAAAVVIAVGFIGWKLIPGVESVVMAESLRNLVLVVGDGGSVAVTNGDETKTIETAAEVPDDFAGEVFLTAQPKSIDDGQAIASAIRGKQFVFGGVSLSGPQVSRELLGSLEGHTISSLSIEKTKHVIGTKEITSFGQIKGLTSLVIRDAPLAQDVGKAFTTDRFSLLEHIHFNSNMITDTDVEAFVRLPALRRLEIYGSKISVEGFGLLSTAKRLAVLDVGACSSVNDSVLPAIAKLSNLRNVRLNDTNITNKGIQHLLEIKNLERLELGGNSLITNGSIDTLKKLKTLTYLGLTGTAVTESGAASLRAALPNCDVVSDK